MSTDETMKFLKTDKPVQATGDAKGDSPKPSQGTDAAQAPAAFTPGEIIDIVNAECANESNELLEAMLHKLAHNGGTSEKERRRALLTLLSPKCESTQDRMAIAKTLRYFKVISPDMPIFSPTYRAPDKPRGGAVRNGDAENYRPVDDAAAREARTVACQLLTAAARLPEALLRDLALGSLASEGQAAEAIESGNRRIGTPPDQSIQFSAEDAKRFVDRQAKYIPGIKRRE